MQCTVEDDLPRESDYRLRHDQAIQRIMNAVETPDRLAENLLMSIRQNRGELTRHRREGEFAQVTAQEVHRVERIVVGAFDGFGEREVWSGTMVQDDTGLPKQV